MLKFFHFFLLNITTEIVRPRIIERRKQQARNWRERTEHKDQQIEKKKKGKYIIANDLSYK